jgi:hypothetical protein
MVASEDRVVVGRLSPGGGEGSPAGVADGERRSLPLAHVAAETTACWIAAAGIGGLALVALGVCLLVDWFPAWADAALAGTWIVLVAVLCLVARRWPRLEHRHTAYAVHASGIEIWKGILWRRVISVPRSRVQHTDVEQGPLQRRYGVATLVIHTAGTEEATVRLDGLAHGTALRIRDFLIRDAAGLPDRRGRGDAA